MTVNPRVGEHRSGDYRLGRSGFRQAILGLFDTAPHLPDAHERIRVGREVRLDPEGHRAPRAAR